MLAMVFGVGIYGNAQGMSVCTFGEEMLQERGLLDYQCLAPTPTPTPYWQGFGWPEHLSNPYAVPYQGIGDSADWAGCTRDEDGSWLRIGDLPCYPLDRARELREQDTWEPTASPFPTSTAEPIPTAHRDVCAHSDSRAHAHHEAHRRLCRQYRAHRHPRGPASTPTVDARNRHQPSSRRPLQCRYRVRHRLLAFHRRQLLPRRLGLHPLRCHPHRCPHERLVGGSGVATSTHRRGTASWNNWYHHNPGHNWHKHPGYTRCHRHPHGIGHPTVGIGTHG